MNILKKIVIWAMLSIMMQLAGLTFLDRVVFQHASKFEIKTIEPTKKETIKVSIPEEAEDISSSYNGRYIKYIEDGKLMLMNTKTAEKKEVVTEEGSEIIYSSWLTRDNYIMIAEKVNGNVKIVTYNARTGIVKPIIDKLTNYNRGLNIDGIVTNGSNSKYVGVSRGGFNSTIYRIDVNDDMNKLDFRVPSLNKMVSFQHKDELVYQDGLNNKFYRYNNRKTNEIKFENGEDLTLLATDENDNIYMGRLEDDKIVSIIYGKVENPTSSWTTINLESPKKTSDIYVTVKGDVMINDSLKGKIVNLNTGDTISYEGKFLQITDKIICSTNEGNLIIKNLSDIDSKEEVEDNQ